MGRLLFSHHVRLDLEDRPLAQRQVVMRVKMRRGESFRLSWVDDASESAVLQRAEARHG